MGSDHRVTMDAIDVLGVAMRSIRQGNPGNAIDILADMQKQMRGIDWEADRKRIATLERERDELATENEQLKQSNEALQCCQVGDGPSCGDCLDCVRRERDEARGET